MMFFQRLAQAQKRLRMSLIHVKHRVYKHGSFLETALYHLHIEIFLLHCLVTAGYQLVVWIVLFVEPVY